MIDGLDVVAVRVESERGVVARMVSTLARRAVVDRTSCERSRVKAIHDLLAVRLKREMEPMGWRPAAAHEELVYREPSVFGGSDTKPQRLQHRSVERPTRLDVPDVDSNVIEEPPNMLFLHPGESTREGLRMAGAARHTVGL